MIPHPKCHVPEGSPLGAPLPVAAPQCLCFLMLPQGLCLSVILPPPNLGSGETGEVRLWVLWWRASFQCPRPDLF